MALPQAAAILKISRQTAHTHARELEAAGVLARIPKTNPIAWQRGSAAGVFLRQARQSVDRPGRFPASAPRLAARVHRDAWKWKVRSGPRQPPPWMEEWEASGVENFALRLSLKDGREFRIWEIRGKTQSTLVIQPPDYLAYDREDLHRAGRQRELDVARLARTFAEKYGYRFDGRLEVAQDAEMALHVPGLELQNAGIPGRTRRWVDHSGPGGAPELETMSMSDTEKFLDFPDWRDTVEHELKAIKMAQQDREDALAQLAQLVRKDGELSGATMGILAGEIAKRQNGNSRVEG
jgi:hypothetical protein